MKNKLKTCILHVGIHKTGSTSIQNAIEGYDDGRTLVPNLSFKNHSVPFQLIFAGPEDYSSNEHERASEAFYRKMAEEILEMMCDGLSEERSFILFSAERLSNLGAGSLWRIREFIQEYCDRIEILMFVREPLGWTASWFQQALTRGFEVRSELVSGNIRDRYQTLAGVFGAESIRVRRYEEKEDFGGDIIDLFAHIVGLDSARLKKPASPANISASELTTQAMYRLNRAEGIAGVYRTVPEARLAFIGGIDRLVEEKGKIDAQRFANAVDWEDFAFVNTLIDRPYALSPASDACLESYMMDMSDALLAALNKHLIDRGVLEAETRDPDLALSLFFVLAAGERLAKKAEG
ncbi:MAG: hypothetical protein AAF160_10270 [Pseudomonadota bacterium]